MRCVSPISIKDPRGTSGSTRLTVPCNKCGACQGNRRAEWSFRLKEELLHSKTAHFITLTYDEDHIPYTDGFLHTLSKKHIRQFIRKLRKYGKIRYYLVGEYGTKTDRPHYHAIIYNGGNDFNKNIQNCWKNREKVSLGLIHCGSVTTGSIHYVTKYHVNYQTEKEWNRQPQERPFAWMSKNPGIGHQYKERVGYWNKNNKYLYVLNNGYKQSLPRYYKKSVFNEAEKENLTEEAIKLADENYNKEVERLRKEGYQNPEYEIELRNYKQALAIQSKRTKESKF